MRILRIVPLPPEFIGGLVFYYKNISINLSKRNNVECDIIAPNLFNVKNKFKQLDSNVKVIYKNCYLYLAGKNPIANIFSFLKKNYNKYDIIHAHGYYFFTTLQCALFKKIRDFPFVLHLTGGIQTPYNPVSSASENFQLMFKELLFDRIIGKQPIQSADAIISVSYRDLEIIKERYNLSSKINSHIPNGVDIVRYKRDEKIERKYITLLATRLSYIKGVDIFLDIAKQLYKKDESLQFLIVGEGPLKELVQEAQKKIPIKLIPSYPYQKMQEIYNNTKILLITSRTEGVPNIIYEGFACETPIISSNVGGISSVITHNKNGLLYDINNYNTAVDLVLDLVNDDDRCKKYGKQARKLIEQEYSWDIITSRVYKFYKNLLELKNKS